MCTKWVPKFWMLSDKSKNFWQKSEGNQSEGNQSEGNQSEGNQSEWNQSEQNQSEQNQSEQNQNFLKSLRAPWSFFQVVKLTVQETGVMKNGWPLHLLGGSFVVLQWAPLWVAKRLLEGHDDNSERQEADIHFLISFMNSWGGHFNRQTWWRALLEHHVLLLEVFLMSIPQNNAHTHTHTTFMHPNGMRIPGGVTRYVWVHSVMKGISRVALFVSMGNNKLWDVQGWCSTLHINLWRAGVTNSISGCDEEHFWSCPFSLGWSFSLCLSQWLHQPPRGFIKFTTITLRDMRLIFSSLVSFMTLQSGDSRRQIWLWALLEPLFWWTLTDSERYEVDIFLLINFMNSQSSHLRRQVWWTTLVDELFLSWWRTCGHFLE